MEKPWQLQMFDKTLKKRQKIALISDMLGPLAEERCLLITGGDNNGALNYKLRELGGRWSWAELEDSSIEEMAEILEEPVEWIEPDRLPYRDSSFDRIVVIDVHEHLPSVESFNREIARALRSGGQAIFTTPNGDPRLPVARLKRWLGMDPNVYGHVVQGFCTEELAAMMREVRIEPVSTGAYSRFFTEIVELGINLMYVKVLGRRNGRRPEEGAIAPKTSGELQAVGAAYRLYSTVFPLVRAFSALDALIPGDGGYAVAVAGRKSA